MLNLMKDQPEVFRPLFCKDEMFIWNFETFKSCISGQFSEDGSNAKSKEVAVFKMFVDFVEYCFFDGKF